MIVEFLRISANEAVPFLEFLKDRKLAKYFSRETAAAVACFGRLLAGTSIDPTMPVYYATGIAEYEEHGLHSIVRNSTGVDGRFSPALFAEQGFVDVPPITQFKLMANMPLCFLSLNFGLTGDNAVICSTASSLLQQALHGPDGTDLLLGAGKSYVDGRVEAGCAVVTKDEVLTSPFLNSDAEAVEIFREWRERSP